ncbi:hypothetical protein DFH09DRAFT_1410979 [Mycena vulgaris]|nr:hypothetical protein DFH09DRAFT_1410979 [Mycena vulgaris]
MFAACVLRFSHKFWTTAVPLAIDALLARWSRVAQEDRLDSRVSVPALAWAPLVLQLIDAGHRVLLYNTTWTGAGGAIAAAFFATFPDLVDKDVVLIASAGLIEVCFNSIRVNSPLVQSSDLSRTAKVMSSPVPVLTANPLIYPGYRHTTEDALVHDLVRLQSAHLPGSNRTVSSSLLAGPVTGLRWAFESRAREGRRVLVVHGTADHTVPPHTHKALLATSTGDTARVELALVPGAGHPLTWTHADAMGTAVTSQDTQQEWTLPVDEWDVARTI